MTSLLLSKLIVRLLCSFGSYAAYYACCKMGVQRSYKKIPRWRWKGVGVARCYASGRELSRLS